MKCNQSQITCIKARIFIISCFLMYLLFIPLPILSQQLPVQTTDLSLRFQHIEPVLDLNGLVAFWAMDEGSGFECLDWSGNKHTAFITGSNWNTTESGLTAAFRNEGKRVRGIYLNGNRWLQIQDAPALNLQAAFTISFWMRPDTIKDAILLDKTTENSGFIVSMVGDASLRFSFFSANQQKTEMVTRGKSISAGEWQQVTITGDALQGIFSFFIDAQLAASVTTGEVTISKNHIDLCICGKTNQLKGFIGSIDETAFFSRILNKEEIYRLYIDGLPKIYRQTRETVDDKLTEWNHFHGNDPIPHPVDDAALLNLRFNGSLTAMHGQQPIKEVTEAVFVPGEFGAALEFSSLKHGIAWVSPIKGNQGTLEIWVIPASIRAADVPLCRIDGENSSLTIVLSTNKVKINFVNNNKKNQIESPVPLVSGVLLHVAGSWKFMGTKTILTLFVNGVPVKEAEVLGKLLLNGRFVVEGSERANFKGCIDDICLSDIAKEWGEVCPRGHVDTEAAALDLMQGFDTKAGYLMHWAPSGNGSNWHLAHKANDNPNEAGCIEQNSPKSLQRLYHPDAFGHNSSIETTLSFSSLNDGWAGVFVQADKTSETLFQGKTFMVNPGKQQMRIAFYDQGSIIAQKMLPYDFPFEANQNYTLTFSAIDGVQRGYIDGHNLISMNDSSQNSMGFAGLVTENTACWFDDIHFSAITPPKENSRKIEQRLITENAKISYNNLSLNTFRWKKRYGLLPWQRNFENPEPAGNIFGPDAATPRPNPSAFWRSEDAANSDILTVNGKMYYFMRGNPDINGQHGNAAIGLLTTKAALFDGIHFTDGGLSAKTLEESPILTGHKDSNKEGCTDVPPRNERFQLNDEGCVYQNGKILVFCREFRHSTPRSKRFHRLVVGVYDVRKEKWEAREPLLIKWSQMNPDSCQSRFMGLNGTPDVAQLRDPVTNEFVIFLYYHNDSTDGIHGLVRGLTYTGETVKLNPRYPARSGIKKYNNDNSYGERIFFDNGIWYMNVNAHSQKLDKDWPDRFEIFTSTHPYSKPWCGSADNTNFIRPYFSRGSKFDPDNGAIWQGSMFKFRNKYYMYYENYHVIDNPETLYEYYNHLQSGSRVGYATAN